jgi:uncharacterized membrane protein YhaH (DUF805 family)/cold shock CspA family protein
MRGEVLHYDAAQGFGFLAGADGQRYSFTRESLRREASLAKGTAVEFSANAGKARDVFVVRAEVPQRPERAQTHFGRAAVAAERSGSTGLWSYFRDSLTANYARFQGRARRKEYWAFALFATLGLVAAGLIGAGLDYKLGNLGPGQEMPVLTLILIGGFWLALLIPGLAVTVRRVHDIGLSGWFVLLGLIPSIGGLIIFVFTVIPSQKHDNRWGPVPAGVPIPLPFTPPAETAPV